MDFSDDLYFSSNALSRLLRSLADDAFKPLGFSSSHAFLLLLVNNQSAIQPSELSNKLQLTPSTITRLIEKMEYRGYVERKSAGRATHVEPTSKSKKIDKKLRMARQQLHEQCTEILGERYTRVLTEMTHKAAKHINESGQR